MPEKYDNQIVEFLKPGLQEANAWFREQNKEIILASLDSLLQSTPKEKSIREIDTMGVWIGRFIIGLVSPLDYASAYEVGESYLAKRAHSARILDKLTHSQRLLFIKDAVMTDVQTANEKWLKQVKVKPIVKGELITKGTKL